jgi:hypothetical protein
MSSHRLNVAISKPYPCAHRLQPPTTPVRLKIGDGIFQQRRTTMNYMKPEVSTIGDATTVIEILQGKPTNQLTEPVRFPVAGPAYDLDE